MSKQEQCVGFIQLVFFDDQSGEVVTLGGAGFVTRVEDDDAWAGVPAFEGATNFQADRMDAKRDIIDQRLVSAETCESLLGLSIAQLIVEGRAKLVEELSSYRQAVSEKHYGQQP